MEVGFKELNPKHLPPPPYPFFSPPFASDHCFFIFHTLAPGPRLWCAEEAGAGGGWVRRGQAGSGVEGGKTGGGGAVGGGFRVLWVEDGKGVVEGEQLPERLARPAPHRLLHPRRLPRHTPTPSAPPPPSNAPLALVAQRAGGGGVRYTRGGSA
eukprot:1011542-Rhodomonas_salina.2